MVLGPSVYDVPLLPYEKELIKTIGLTEEEYRKFAAEVRRRGMVRPAAYDHIPDVKAAGANPGTAILVNLAISLVLTGVAYLLTPKPKMPRAKSAINLGDITGPTLFTPSRGFETLAELADYQSAIPLIFGRYDSTEKVGGMLVTPKLVWSRMFSYGAMQQAKLMFVVGEQGVGDGGIEKPEQVGIFLGNNALDPLYKEFFAFYWKNDKADDESNNILNKHKRYGVRGPEIADKQADDDEVFVSPPATDNDEINFCHAFSPANNTEFGIYAPIANGTGYSLNYEIVSVGDSLEQNPLRVAIIARIKIAGCKNKVERAEELDNLEDMDAIRDDHQDSFGRNYSPRMGIVSVKASGTPVEATESEMQKDVNVSVDDTAIFLISHTSVPDNFYKRRGKGEGVGDINATVESLQIAADDAMQIGELFAIGGTIWEVTKRKLSNNQRFDPDVKEDQEITLKCIETENALNPTIGVVSKRSIINPSKEYIGDTFEDSGRQNIAEVFFPITKIATGIVRNNRPAIATEIGIKSTVFQRLNGLCAFNSLPTPSEIGDFQKDDLQVRTGSNTSTILRTSAFKVLIKKAGTNASFEALRNTASNAGLLIFVVRGSTPIAQYNFIRFILPETQELEFKLVPISGAELRRTENTQQLIDLSHSPSSGPGSSIGFAANVPGFGEIRVETSGNTIERKKVTENKEFYREFVEIEGGKINNGPTEISNEKTLPAAQFGAVAITVKKVAQTAARPFNVANITTSAGKAGAFAYQLLQEAGVLPEKRANKDKIKVTTTELIDNRRITLKWTFVKILLSSTHYAKANGINWSWYADSVQVIDSFPSFTVGEELIFKRGLQSTNADQAAAAYTDSNPFKTNNPGGTLTWSGLRFKVDSVGSNGKIQGRIQGYRYELFGNADQRSLGDTETEFVTMNANADTTKNIKIKLTSEVILTDPTEENTFGQKQKWGQPSIEIREQATSKNWVKGDRATDLKTVSDDNPYKTVYTSVGAEYEIKNIDITEDDPVSTRDTAFARSTQISDISHYRSLVEKSNATKPEHEIVYVNEIQLNKKEPTFKSLTLAGLSLKAGRQFTALDQLRVWLGKGIEVERLHPDKTRAYEDTAAIGPSNLLTDLVFYLLTDQIGGAGALLGMRRDTTPLIDKNELVNTSKFLHGQKLFFNGAMTDRTNLRQFIADIAPYFLCNFIVSDGKFSLKPALPVLQESGEINDGPVQIEQLFTSGNILEDTFKVEYLGVEERRPFQAVVRYRQERKNRLPEEKTLTVESTDPAFDRTNVEFLPVEQFDLTQFCTSEHHALMVAKYFLSLRQLVTHTISFSTTLEGLSIQAGSFIKVVTEASPYSSANNGTIDSTGQITSVSDLPDGQFTVDYFSVSGSDDIERGVMNVFNETVTDSTFHNSVFTLVNETVSQNIYVVEQLTFSQEGTVDIVASEYPCDDQNVSKLVKLIYGDNFKTLS